RSIPVEDASVRNGGWQQTVGGDLDGHRLGVVGLGRLGMKVARVGHASGMDVVAWSQNLDAERARGLGGRAVSKEELLSTSDVITIQYEVRDGTCRLISPAELDIVHPNAVPGYSCRRGLDCTDALNASLEAGRSRAPALVVHDLEPLPAHHRLGSTPPTVLSLHVE